MARVILFVVLYLLGAYLADQFIHAPGQVALFWPASGLALGFLVRYGLKWVVPLLIANLLVHVLISPVPYSFLPFSLSSNAVGGLLGAYYVRSKNLNSFIRFKPCTGHQNLIFLRHCSVCHSNFSPIGPIYC